MNKIIKNNQGFSLVEIMVSVGLIAVLTLLANAAYKGYRENALRTVAVSNARNIAKAYNVCTSAGGNCVDFEGIQMGHVQGATFDEIGTDDICFALNQSSGSQVIKSCVSINLASGKETYTLGWYAGGNNITNNNPDMMCYCAGAGGSNPILQGTTVKCTSASPDCDNVGSCSGSGITKQCLAQKGECQSTGLCI